MELKNFSQIHAIVPERPRRRRVVCFLQWDSVFGKPGIVT